MESLMRDEKFVVFLSAMLRTHLQTSSRSLRGGGRNRFS